MQLFYILTVKGDNGFLGEAESKHAIKILRLAKGDRVHAVDGKGGFYTTEIIDANPKKCRLKILDSQQEFGKKDFHLHIAIAPTKNIDRFGWFLEKATEIGIDEITPILTEHSERKIIRPERLQKILIAAMKQSLKAYLPKLNEITYFKDFIAENNVREKFIAHCNEGKRSHLKDIIKKGRDVLILIGPEGDFSFGEVKQASDKGYTGISLGSSRLRTETSGIVACLMVNLLND